MRMGRFNINKWKKILLELYIVGKGTYYELCEIIKKIVKNEDEERYINLLESSRYIKYGLEKKNNIYCEYWYITEQLKRIYNLLKNNSYGNGNNHDGSNDNSSKGK